MRAGARAFRIAGYIAAGLAGVGLGLFAILRQDISFLGRATGNVVSLHGLPAVAFGLISVAVGALCLGRAVPHRPYRRALALFGSACIMIAVLAQLYWVFAA
jgi:hypothetical protein